MYNCDFCKKEFNNRSNKYRHQKICKSNVSTITLTDIYNELRKLNDKIDQYFSNKIESINIKNFGQETMEALDLESISNCLLTMDIRCLLEQLHYSKEYPENNNIRIKSMRRKVIQIYENNRWSSISYEKGIKFLIKQAIEIFQDYLHENKEIAIKNRDFNEEELEELLVFLNQAETEENKELNKELLLMLESSSNNTS